jgi:ribulose-5-phosphate 4-epimerase/fuculose-1-phosphate aldolase
MSTPSCLKEYKVLSSVKPLSAELVDDLLVGNRILFKYGIVDAFGHISVRHDSDPETYVMSRHLAPGLVEAEDLITYDLDSNPIPETKHRLYSERYIHGEIYKARPDVISVVHCHAPTLIPFGITKGELQPVYHMSSFLGLGVPKFEIRDSAGMTDMLIRTAPIGKALAAVLGDHPMVLMRGHGATMVGKSIKHAVYRAVYAAQNAQIQMEAMRFGEVTYLAKEEADNYERYIDEVIHRPWNMWKREVVATA